MSELTDWGKGGGRSARSDNGGNDGGCAELHGEGVVLCGCWKRWKWIFLIEGRL
jgi:hypothetical protein